MVWAILKTLIGRRTQDKVTVCGKNFQKKLHAAIHVRARAQPTPVSTCLRAFCVDRLHRYLAIAHG